MYPIGANSSELMYDTFDYVISAGLGQQFDKQPLVIYYAGRTLDDTQLNYSPTKKKFLRVMFALKKFRSYLIGSPITIYTDQASHRQLLAKKDVTTWLIKWTLLLQEFYLQIHDKKGSDNLVADHFSRLSTTPSFKILVNDYFSDEQTLCYLDGAVVRLHRELSCDKRGIFQLVKLE